MPCLGFTPSRLASAPIVAMLSCALMLAACATRVVLPPSVEIRRQLQEATVAAHDGDTTKGAVETPVAGAGAGATMGALQTLGGSTIGGCQSPSGPFGCVLGIAVGIVGSPVGAVVGAIRAHGEVEVRAAEASFRLALAEVEPDVGLARELMAAAGKVPSVRLQATPTESPAADDPGENVRRSGVTLDVTVFDFELRSRGLIEPDVTLAMKVTARVVPAAGGEALYWRTWGYKNVERDYFELAADNAAAFRAEIETAYRVLAEKMIDDLFVSTAPEEIEDAPSEGGQAWTVDASSAADSST